MLKAFLVFCKPCNILSTTSPTATPDHARPMHRGEDSLVSTIFQKIAHSRKVFPIHGVVDLHTKIFSFCNDFKRVISRFLLQRFAFIFWSFMHWFCGNKHGMSFHYINRKIVAFEPYFNLCNVTADGLIQLSDITCS